MHDSYGQDYDLTRSLIAILSCWHTSYRSNNDEVPKFNTELRGCALINVIVPESLLRSYGYLLWLTGNETLVRGCEQEVLPQSA